MRIWDGRTNLRTILQQMDTLRHRVQSSSVLHGRSMCLHRRTDLRRQEVAREAGADLAMERREADCKTEDKHEDFKETEKTAQICNYNRIGNGCQTAA